MANYSHSHVALGGSFDHFHIGHQALLETAFTTGKFVTIGVTSDKFVKGKILASAIQPYTTRVATLKRYLKNQNWLSRSRLTQLSTPAGSALHSKTITALITSPKTKSQANQINQQRRRLSLAPFQIITAELVKSTDRQHMSSTRIRLGQILPNGFLTIDYFQNPITVEKATKTALRRRSWGPTFSTPAKLNQYLKKQSPTLVIAVGDQTTHSLLNSAIKPEICIIDHQINHQPTEINLKLQPTISVKNPAGEIKPRLASAIQQIIHQHLLRFTTAPNFAKADKATIIKVRGEEDLAAAPACLLAPLNSIVVFGYKDQLVAVTTDSKTKQKLIDTLHLVPETK